MSWRFIEGALREYLSALAYYDEISLKLADRFASEFRASMAYLCVHPTVGLLGPRSTRRRRLRSFPYIIVFRDSGDQIDVLAVAHERRGDDYWEFVFER
ncbi:MAG: type II toxin-antitoxin system RelE/ParE family toxin [Verrucomicrobiales bacterium]|nr:type II toxin-antitoxin system RelE/ParE family toxin [Verrucomicrobiales bacterium]MCP5558926.1 type II toxin-antitoxin system RelE/ParE family toxin [Verrucomicrobiaceae bacterium]